MKWLLIIGGVICFFMVLFLFWRNIAFAKKEKQYRKIYGDALSMCDKNELASPDAKDGFTLGVFRAFVTKIKNPYDWIISSLVFEKLSPEFFVNKYFMMLFFQEFIKYGVILDVSPKSVEKCANRLAKTLGDINLIEEFFRFDS